uniref:Uncharacterized protein n=1 Tax=Triticum urartu TaxID=4572 RepID=A0A8R7PN51_TRIUA
IRRSLDDVLRVYHPDVLHDPVDVRQESLGGVELAEALQPGGQQRGPAGVAEKPVPGDLHGGVHQRHHAAQHDVNVPDPFAAEEAALPGPIGAVAQPPLQRVRGRHHPPHPPGPLLLGAGPVRLLPRRPQHVVGVGRPEPGDGALVGVGGEQGWGPEGLVDVLEDDLRLADGAAVVDEHGHGAVDGVAAEEEVALAAQVLLHVRVAHALEVQRQPHPRHVRAPPVAQQRHLLVSSAAGHRPPTTLSR